MEERDREQGEREEEDEEEEEREREDTGMSLTRRDERDVCWMNQKCWENTLEHGDEEWDVHPDFPAPPRSDESGLVSASLE